MRSQAQLKARARELKEEVEKATAAVEEGRLDKKRYKGMVDRAVEESNEIQAELKAHDQANRMMGAQEVALAALHGDLPSLPVAHGEPIQSASPMDLSAAQLKGFYTAAATRQPFSVQLNQPTVKGGFGAGFMGGVSTKSPVLESGIGGGFSGNLPPVQTQFAVGMGYESTRISSLIPGAAMTGPSATWLSHTANANEVTGVAENGAKPDVQPTIINNQVKPQKIAGYYSMSLEAWQDTEQYGEGSFASWLPVELSRSLINSESLYLLQATTAGTNSISGGPVNSTFNGLLNQSGVLTRSVGSDTVFDALSKAYVDLRVGSAYANPDLVLMNPTTLGAIRRIKNDQGNYILDLLAGPNALTADGSPSTVAPANSANSYSLIPQGHPELSGVLWGAPIAASTQVPAGTAVVMSVRAGGALFWQRLGMQIQFNPYSGFANNIYYWVAEERVALSVQRPSAVNILTGLPAS